MEQLELNKKLLTIEEAAEYLNIKVSRLRTAVHKHELVYHKVGRLIRFKSSDLNKWVTKVEQTKKSERT